MRELAYGRQRLVEIAVALGLEPKVLLLDEPAAGVPSAESGTIIEMIERLPPEIAVLIIEHDMDLVFRLARRITVLVQGARAGRGTAGRRSPPIRACARSISASGSRHERARADVAPRSPSTSVRAGYGDTVVLDGVSLGAAGRRHAGASWGATASARRRLLATIMGHTTLHGGAIRFAGQRAGGAAALSPRAARHRLRAAGARDLPFADGGGESDGRGAAGALDRCSASTTSFPRSPSGAATAATSCRAASSRC